MLTPLHPFDLKGNLARGVSTPKGVSHYVKAVSQSLKGVSQYLETVSQTLKGHQ